MGRFFFCDELAISQTIFVELGVFPLFFKEKKKRKIEISRQSRTIKKNNDNIVFPFFFFFFIFFFINFEKKKQSV